MLRVSERQKKDNVILDQIDTYLYNEYIEVKNNKIILTKDLQLEFILDNIFSFADITKIIAELLKLQETTVILIDSTTKEEVEATIEIEGGI